MSKLFGENSPYSHSIRYGSGEIFFDPKLSTNIKLEDSLTDYFVDGVSICQIEGTNCCGFHEVCSFQYDDDPYHKDWLKIICPILENWEEIPSQTAGFFINPVSSWKSYPKIARSLRRGGWKLAMKPTKNPNSGNMITTWVYTVGTKKPVRATKKKAVNV